MKPGEIADLRGARRPEVEGPGLHALRAPHLQPLADGRDDRPPRRAEGRGLGARAVQANLARDPKGGDTDQLKAVAAGAMRRHDLEPVLLRAPAALGQARRARGRRAHRHRHAEPEDLGHARQHLRRGRAEERAATARRRSSSSSTWRATRRSATSPTATTSGRSVASVKVDNPVLNALGDFKRDRSTWRCSAQPAGARRRSTTAWPGSSASKRRSAPGAGRPRRSPATARRPRPGARPSPGCRPRSRACRS